MLHMMCCSREVKDTLCEDTIAITWVWSVISYIFIAIGHQQRKEWRYWARRGVGLGYGLERKVREMVFSFDALFCSTHFFDPGSSAWGGVF